jgi:hypothetical protein
MYGIIWTVLNKVFNVNKAGNFPLKLNFEGVPWWAIKAGRHRICSIYLLREPKYHNMQRGVLRWSCRKQKICRQGARGDEFQYLGKTITAAVEDTLLFIIWKAFWNPSKYLVELNCIFSTVSCSCLGLNYGRSPTPSHSNNFCVKIHTNPMFKTSVRACVNNTHLFVNCRRFCANSKHF